ncbi:MAG: glycosyltransferase [Bacteroidales bacterium]|nr:glycosyltransferase [Bacteroidales bacterium]
MPTVSVIVPNYNHASFLGQRIDSILGQTFQDFELILLDDSSTDGSWGILENYRNNPHVSHLIQNESNSGSAFRQWKKGIELAQGKWIWIAESDDYAEPSFLGRLMAEVQKTPDCVLAYTDTWWVDQQGNTLWETPHNNRVNTYSGRDFIRQKQATCNSIANVSECIFRRDCYRPSESYRYEHMRLCGDWLFYVLLAEQGSVVEVEEPLSYYRQHGSNISNDAERRGLTFLEGVDVLDYMVEHCGLKRSDYARGWARMWSRYEKQYEFSAEVQKQVRQRLMQRHKAIVFFHSLYRIKSWLR